MAFKMKYKNLKEVVKQLNSAVVAHGKQAKIIDKHIVEMEKSSPMKGKKDACYHKVKRKSKVWPTAYASGRLVQCRKVGAANYGESS